MEDNNEDWREEPRGSMAQYYPLKGERGEEILIFTGPPEKTLNDRWVKDNEPPKVEWHFPAWHGEFTTPISGQSREVDWEEVLITESGKNFRAALSVFQGVHGWNKPCVVAWKLRDSKKAKYKAFTITEVVVPNLP